MGKKLYVGNLSYSVTEEMLSSTFSEFGTVESAKVIMDPMSGRSKGFGFVEMSSDDEAQAAIESLDSKEFEGRTLKVSEARPPSNNRNGGGNRGFGGGRGGNRGFGGGRNRGGSRRF